MYICGDGSGFGDGCISSTYFTIKLINNIIFFIISFMTFDELEMKYRNTIIIQSSNFKKPTLMEYKEYLNKYFDKIRLFIDYHIELEEPYCDLPKISKRFLNQMRERLTTLDEYTKTYFYSPADIHIKLNMENYQYEWNNDTLNHVILGVSWINFKISYLWYKKLIELGYKHNIIEVFDADD